MPSILAGNLEIESHLLAALQRSLSIRPIERLVCRFPATAREVVRHLHMLEDIIARSRGPSQLDLCFSEDIMQGGPAFDSVVAAFRDVMCAIAAKRPGPAIFLDTSGRTMSCRPSDLRDWKLHESLFPHSSDVWGKIFPWLRGLPVPNLALQTASTRTIRNHSGQSIPSFTVSRLQSVQVRSVGSLSGPFNSCTLFVNGGATRRQLMLGGTVSVSPLSSAEVTAIMPHLTLPKLAELHISDLRIDPAILSAFLRRHPTIVRLFYTPEQPGLGAVLVEPPVNLPQLVYLGSLAAESLPQLLNGIGPSPPHEIGIPFIRRTPADRTSLNAALRSIAARETRTCLVLLPDHDFSNTSESSPLDSDETDTAQSLRCVDAAVVHVNGDEHARSTLPWVSQLPALGRVAFQFARDTATPREEEERNRFRAEAIALLPNVAVHMR